MSIITAQQSAALTLLAEQNLLTDSIAAAILGATPKADASIIADATASLKPRAAKPKATRQQTVKPKAAKKAATIAPARTTAKPQTARSLDTAKGSITKGQMRRISAIAATIGVEYEGDMSDWSMADASAEYATLKAEVAAAR